MKRLLLCLFMCVGSLISMEQADKKKKMKSIAKAMAHQARGRYYDALTTLDELKKENLSGDDKALLRKMATKSKYAPILQYAFEEKKILPNEELASCLLVEAAITDCSNLGLLLSYKVNPNTPGKLLYNFGNEKARLLTPLVEAIGHTKVVNVNVLLEASAEVNTCLPHENLPLMEALFRYHLTQHACQKLSGVQTDFGMQCQAVLTLVRQKNPDPLKDNGENMKINVTLDKTDICKNAWEMACKLGYEGIAKGFEQSLGEEEFSRRFEELYQK